MWHACDAKVTATNKAFFSARAERRRCMTAPPAWTKLRVTRSSIIDHRPLHLLSHPIPGNTHRRNSLTLIYSSCSFANEAWHLPPSTSQRRSVTHSRSQATPSRRHHTRQKHLTRLAFQGAKTTTSPMTSRLVADPHHCSSVRAILTYSSLVVPSRRRLCP